MRHKKPAEINIGIDLDKGLLNNWPKSEKVSLIHADATTYLTSFPFNGDEFVYADPPYLLSSRQSHRRLYKYNYSERQHVELLEKLTALRCKVMVSSYHAPLYEQYLTSWRALRYHVRTRSGSIAEEVVWMNYPSPKELHDYRYLGETFRDRERIRRRIQRWTKRFKDLPLLERNALLDALSHG